MVEFASRATMAGLRTYCVSPFAVGTCQADCQCCAATAAFLAPEQYRGAFIPVYDEMLTSREMLGTLSKQIGVPVT